MHGKAKETEYKKERNTLPVKKAAMIFSLLLCASLCVRAQDDPEYRMEIGGGVGVTGYLGDFNGNLTHDLQPMASVMGRYIFNPWMALRLNVSYGKMKGSSADVETWYPDYADTPYEFSNALYDASLTYEYNFLAYGTGWDYRGAKRVTPFVFGGMGLCMAKTPAKSRLGFNVPVGIGVKCKLGERVNLGLEWDIHFTQSDWLDGAKDPYHIDSSGIFKNTDCFSQLQVTLTYSFAPKCVNCNKE